MADVEEKVVLESSYEITWSKVHGIPLKCTFDAFLDSVNVWIDKPHVVNRRLSGSLILKRGCLSRKSCEDLMRFESTTVSKITAEDISSRIDKYLNSKDLVDESSAVEIILRRLLPRLMSKSDRLVEIVIIDKTNKEISFVPVCTEKPQISTDSNDDKHDTDMIPYRILYQELVEQQTSIVLHVSTSTVESSLADNIGGDGVVCPSIKWLRDQLLPKLKKWAENPVGNSQGSLRLISLEKYTMLYQTLKEKYGWDLVKRWPENTDPQKFVFEDIAIATYLIILWEAEREKKKLTKKQSFIDLGCGNGLLVYILCKEGYPGSGIDIRKRKIWELYGPSVTLEENPLDPTASDLFPDIDWLIGNHSDELTPWLPVIAARSSYNTRYFVLPCCFYDFNCKYVRKDNKTSQYRGYLDFVHHVGVTCGFEVQEDMLRIPSTKRVCQIGQSRTYQAKDHQMMDEKIKAFIRERGCDIDQGQQPQTLKTTAKTTSDDHETNHDQTQHEQHQNASQILSESENGFQTRAVSRVDTSSVNDSTGSPPCKKQAVDYEVGSSSQSSVVFQPREHAIEVRNCSQLSKSLREFIVDTVVQALLTKEQITERKDNLIDKSKERVLSCLGKDEQNVTSTGKSLKMWRKGRIMSLADIAKLFDKDTLKKLKNECGGIQTLLRNHRYIFKVVGGAVELRDWRQEQPGPKLTNGDPEYLRRRYKALRNTSLCWFHFNHPDGCVLQTEQCTYAHSEDELVERPSQEHLKFL